MKIFPSNSLVFALVLFVCSPCIADEMATVLLSDWEKSSEVLKSVNYLSFGTFHDEFNPDFYYKYLQNNGYKNEKIVYVWKNIKHDNRFLIEISNNNFEWNPKISPNGNHLLFSFDGTYYTFLRSNQNSEYELKLYKDGKFKLRPPSGSIESQSYIQKTEHFSVSPLDSNDLRARVQPVIHKESSSRINHIMNGIQNDIPYPFSPYDLVSNPFYKPDMGMTNSNICKYLLDHPKELKTIDFGSYISLNIPISVSTKTLWIPEKILFKKINNVYTPFHFSGGNEYIKGSKRSIFREVEIQNWTTKNNIAIPSKIKIQEFHNNDNNQLELAKIQAKILDRIEIGKSLTMKDITPNIPTYAEMHKDGVWIKNTPIPDPPTPTWIYSIIILVASLVLGLVVKTIKRIKNENFQQ